MAQQNKQLKKPLGFLTGPHPKTADMFHSWGCDTTQNIKFIKECDFAVFVDAAPAVTPFLYGHNRMQGARGTDARLDKRENRFYRMLSDDLPKFGFGRGALFLNVMNGGASYQMVDGHVTGHHALRIIHDEKFQRVTSRRVMMAPTSHMEMMVPSRVCAAMTMACAGSSSVRYVENRKIEIDNNKGMAFTDPEILYYYDSNSLCVQPVVGECSQSEPVRVYFRKLFNHIMAAASSSSSEPATTSEVVTN